MNDSSHPQGRKQAGGRLIVVSNRLPVVLKRGANRRWYAEPGSGGLVSAMLPVLRNRGGTWIGWTGTTTSQGGRFEKVLASASQAAGYELVPLVLTDEEQEKYYHGFSNEVLWPLCHDTAGRANFDPEYWPVYQAVNRKFAEVIATQARAGDFIWIHDYQLMLTAIYLREMGISNRISFFLHIPFPSLDIFLRMPQRFEILDGLMRYDLIGFQTQRDRRNFLQCVRSMFGPVELKGKGRVADAKITLRRSVARRLFGTAGETTGETRTVTREFRVGAFPISIDTSAYERIAQQPDVKTRAAEIRANMSDRKIILSVSRLDYSKGIPQTLQAFRDVLRRYPDWCRAVSLVQVVVPSRREVPAYERLRVALDQLVGEINGEFTQTGWVPVHYLYRSLAAEDLMAYYRAANVALIAPLKDGMNLVAKEYIAAHAADAGVLILSEFAGAAAELHQHALMVNPHDIRGMADAIHESLLMPAPEQRRRMRRMRRIVESNTIFHWVESFLDASLAVDLDAFPIIEDFVPMPAGELLGGEVPALPL